MMKFSEDSLKSIITALCSFPAMLVFSFHSLLFSGSLLSPYAITNSHSISYRASSALFFISSLPVKTFFGSKTNFPIDSMKFLNCLNKSPIYSGTISISLHWLLPTINTNLHSYITNWHIWKRLKTNKKQKEKVFKLAKCKTFFSELGEKILRKQFKVSAMILNYVNAAATFLKKI